jgi:hypothetical protein
MAICLVSSRLQSFTTKGTKCSSHGTVDSKTYHARAYIRILGKSVRVDERNSGEASAHANVPQRA